MGLFRLSLAVVLLVSGCTSPAHKFRQGAEAAGFQQQVFNGPRFDYLILSRTAPAPSSDRLHVYIEGDGSAWIANRWIAEDPTPRKPVALELMRLDPGPVVYLGRPCYFGLQRNCSPKHWTSARYSDDVVQGMATALRGTLERWHWSGKLVLVGHSGGGVLAMLLAARVPEVDTVVTLGANLNVEAWARLHGYSALSGSLDPAREPPLPERIRQFHLVGGQDRNVPPASALDVVRQQPAATVLRYPEFDHTCCWGEVWPSLLAKLP